MEALFEITVTCPRGMSTGYAEDAEGAYLAYWTFRREAATVGKKHVRIENLATGEVVLNGEVN